MFKGRYSADTITLKRIINGKTEPTLQFNLIYSRLKSFLCAKIDTCFMFGNGKIYLQPCS
jgi:hypothetical protein